jgi:hypothetical protein
MRLYPYQQENNQNSVFLLRTIHKATKFRMQLLPSLGSTILLFLLTHHCHSWQLLLKWICSPSTSISFQCHRKEVFAALFTLMCISNNIYFLYPQLQLQIYNVKSPCTQEIFIILVGVYVRTCVWEVIDISISISVYL